MKLLNGTRSCFCHVSDGMMGKSRCGKRIGDDNNKTAVKVLVSGEPNQKGPGFSSCMLDVSDFPAGSYRIKWHSCLIVRVYIGAFFH